MAVAGAVVAMVASFNNDNNNDFLCANILEDQAQWRDKTIKD